MNTYITSKGILYLLKENGMKFVTTGTYYLITVDTMPYTVIAGIHMLHASDIVRKHRKKNKPPMGVTNKQLMEIHALRYLFGQLRTNLKNKTPLAEHLYTIPNKSHE